MNHMYLTIIICLYHYTLINCLLSDRGDYIGRVVVNTTKPDGFIDRFTSNHPEYTYRQRINERYYFIFDIDQSKRTKEVSKFEADKDISNLKLDPEIEFVQQEILHQRVIKTRDPEWDNLWHLNGNVTPSMNITEAWAIGYSGRGIKIAILDNGLQTNHPDLDSNVDIALSHDYYDDDDDPTHAYGESHGTKVAGLIAAIKDNEVCTVGVAYESTIIGVRILGELGITDSVEAQALIHSLSNVDIYSNSWGPTDGYGFSSPGILTQEALETGISKGRGGKGVIYTWAAGNGGLRDNCNGDGYVNSIYTIGITSVQSGQNAWYSEVCAAALAATYGGSSSDRYLTSTTTSSGCTDDGLQGTSFSTPIASAIIAQTLQANPNLTWRDIQHLIVLTSSSSGFTDSYSNWTLNGALKEYSQVLGFGLMDARAMVTQAKQWTTVPSQQDCTTSTRTPLISTNGSKLSTDSTSVTASDCSAVVFLEHVTVTIWFSYSKYRGVTEFYLVSPSGAESHLLHFRYDDAIKFESGDTLTWTFMSVHFWWENPLGTWTLQFRSTEGYSTVTLYSWYLTFYGTTTDPRHNTPVNLSTTATPSPSTTSSSTTATTSSSTTTTTSPSTTTTSSSTTTTSPSTTSSSTTATPSPSTTSSSTTTTTSPSTTTTTSPSTTATTSPSTTTTSPSTTTTTIPSTTTTTSSSTTATTSSSTTATTSSSTTATPSYSTTATTSPSTTATTSPSTTTTTSSSTTATPSYSTTATTSPSILWITLVVLTSLIYAHEQYILFN